MWGDLCVILHLFAHKQLFNVPTLQKYQFVFFFLYESGKQIKYVCVKHIGSNNIQAFHISS